MKRTIRLATCLLIGLLMKPERCHAWWSVGGQGSTHFVLGKKAYDLIGATDYPDLARFKGIPSLGVDGIEEWVTGPTNDANAHGKRYRPDDAGDFDGGPVQRWWGLTIPTFSYGDASHGVLPQYKFFNFGGSEYSAYFYLALMTHLVADQGVPAHAANIFHAQPWYEQSLLEYGDNLERAAHFTAANSIQPSVKTLTGSDPTVFYHDPFNSGGLLDVTQRLLPGWKVDGVTEYWIKNDLYLGAPFDDINWGHYGGLSGDPSDPKYGYRDIYDSNSDPDNIIQSRYLQSISFQAGVLCAASKQLPPLVRDFAIRTAPGDLTRRIDAINGTDIEFAVLENRKPSVKISIKAFNEWTRKGYFVATEAVTWNGRETGTSTGLDEVTNLSFVEHLPWEKTFQLSAWKGTGVEEGTSEVVPLPNGVYSMKIFVEDEDHNEVNTVYPDINQDTDAGGDLFTANDTERAFRIARQLHVEIRGVTDGAVYSSPVTAISYAHGDPDLIKSYGVSFGDDSKGDRSTTFDPPVAQETTVHKYAKKCADTMYSVWTTATDVAGTTVEAGLRFSIEGVHCPNCFSCLDTQSGAVCKMNPGAVACQPPPWVGPDDNVDLATNPPEAITSLASYDRGAPIGVLQSGFYTEMFKLMTTFGAEGALVGTGFDPSIVTQIKVLVIPSGGLYGMENSQMFRNALAEYARRGGVIVSMAQAYGREYTALPGAPNGYGWMQDTGCFTQAFYIDNYHQMLSGQEVINGSSDAEVDGYFTDVPEGTEVYLRRTRNGQPGLIAYAVGAGRVIATTAYTDWAFANGQAALGGQHLVRDMLAWALEAKQLSEFRAGATAEDLPVSVYHAGNPGAAPAEQVKLSVYTPDRALFSEQIVDAHVEPQTLIETSLPALTLPAAAPGTYGIWWVDYTLLDAAGTPVQAPVSWNRFVVSPASFSPYQQRNYVLSIQTDSDYYPLGGRAEITYMVFNNTDEDQTLKVAGEFPIFDAVSLVVPAHGHNQMIRVMEPLSWQWGAHGWANLDHGGVLRAHLYYPGGQTQDLRDLYVYVPEITLEIHPDRDIYAQRGVAANLEVSATNPGPAVEHDEISLSILDPNGAIVFEQYYGIDPGPGARRTDSFAYTFPADAPFGTYTAVVTATSARGEQIGSKSKTFLLLEDPMQVKPTFPAAFDTSNSIVLTVTSFVDVDEAHLTARMLGPDGAEVWSGQQTLSALVADVARDVDLTVDIPQVIFGDYRFEYQVDFMGRSISGARTISSGLGQLLSLSPEICKINGVLEMRSTVINTGDFRQRVTVWALVDDTASVPQSFVLEPGLRRTVSMLVRLGPTITSGVHEAVASVVIPSGRKTAVTKSVTVAYPDDASIAVSMENSVVRIREQAAPNLNISAGNAFDGTLNVDCRIDVPLLGYTDHATLSLTPGQRRRLAAGDGFLRSIPIPETATAGTYPLTATLTFPNGETTEATTSFRIEPSRLVASAADHSALAGGDISAQLSDQGGVDTDYRCELALRDGQDLLVSSRTVTGRIRAGEGETLLLPVPDSAASSSYFFKALCTDQTSSETVEARTMVDITGGVAAYLDVEPDAPEYFPADEKIAYTDISNDSEQGQSLNGASLRLRVYSPTPSLYTCDDGGADVCAAPPATASAPVNPYISVSVPDRIPDSGIFTVTATMDRSGANFVGAWIMFDGHPLGLFDSSQPSFKSFDLSDGRQYVSVSWTVAVQPHYPSIQLGPATIFVRFYTEFTDWDTWTGEEVSATVCVTSDHNPYLSVSVPDRLPEDGVFEVKVTSTPKDVCWWGCWYGAVELLFPQDALELVDSADVDQYGRVVKALDQSGPTTVTWRMRATGMVTGKLEITASFLTEGSVDITAVICVPPWFGQETPEGIVVWEQNVPVDVVDFLSLETPFAVDGRTGKFYLEGVLSSATSQLIAKSSSEFYVVNGDFPVTTGTDKRRYERGEVVAIAGEVRNAAALAAENLRLKVYANGVEVFAEDFTLEAKESHAYALAVPADTLGRIGLNATLLQNGIPVSTIDDSYTVVGPQGVIELTAPALVGADPFPVRAILSNTGTVPINVTLTLSDDRGGAPESRTLTVPPAGSSSLDFVRSITADTNFTAVLSGDVTSVKSVLVPFGLAAAVELYPNTYYSEGPVSVWYDVTNAGQLPGSIPVTFELRTSFGQVIETRTENTALPTVGDGSYVDARVNFDTSLSGGLYVVAYSTYGAQGAASFTVIKPTGTLSVEPSPTYPVGSQEIPVRIENTGLGWWVDFTAAFELYEGADLIASSTETVGLWACEQGAGVCPESTYTGTLAYQLPAGDYTIRYSLNGAPAGSASFRVLPSVVAALNVSVGASVDGMVPVALAIANNGYHEFSGRINLQAASWATSQPVVSVPSGEQARWDFAIDLRAASPGAQDLVVRLLDDGGQLIDTVTVSFVVRGAEPSISRHPEQVDVPAGGVAPLTYCVRNQGDQESYAQLMVEAFEGSQVAPVFLAVGEEACLDFTVPIPEDIEEKDYDASYTLSRVDGATETHVAEGRTAIHVQSVKIEIDATLDKKLYRKGDVAHLALDVRSIGSITDVALTARVHFGDFEELRPFVLTAAGNHLAFDVPVANFDGRLMYEVTLGTGRSIYINTLFIQEQYDRIWLSADKTAYRPGEDVVLTIEAAEVGTVGISALLGTYARTILLSPQTPATATLTLPPDLFGGTQIISYDFNGESHAYRFNVDSLVAKFVDARLDKARYEVEEAFRLNLQLLSNSSTSGWIDGYIETPRGDLLPVFTCQGSFDQGINEVDIDGTIAAAHTGMHKLVYFFYADEARSQILTSGAEAFDVGSFALTRVLADKDHYRQNLDPVVITASIAGEANGTLALLLDEQTLEERPVIAAGYSQETFTIAPERLGAGNHTARVVLQVGAAASSQEVVLSVRKAPAVPVFDATPSLTNSLTLNCAGGADPLARVDLWVNGAAVGSTDAGAAGRFTFSQVPLGLEGDNTIEAAASDGDGTTSARTSTIVRRDTMAPAVAITSPSTGTISAPTPLLSYTVSDGDVAVLVDGQLVATRNSDALAPLADGAHRVRVQAVDVAGNTGFAETLITVQAAIPQEITMTVATTAGRILSGVPVYAFAAVGGYTGRRVVSDASGKAAFSTTGLGAGVYTFRADYLGYQFWSPPLTVPGCAGGLIGIAEETATVTVAQGATPKTAVPVCLFTGGGTYLGLSNGTDAAGKVTFALPAGKDYKFRADYLGSQYFSPVVTIAAGGPNAPRIDVGGGVLTVAVDQGNGQPISGASVYLFSASGTYLNTSKTTDASGRAVFTVSSGSYKTRVDYLGYQFWSDVAMVSADMGLVVSIPHRTTTIAVSGSYVGFLEARTNVLVYLFTQNGTYLNKTLKTSAEGRVSFNLPDRGYKARVDYLGSQYWTAAFSGGDVPLQIAEAVAEVTVTRSSSGIANVPVYLFSSGGAYLNVSAKSDASGKVSLRLPAQTFKFRADYQGAQFFSANTTLLADTVNPVTIATGGGTFTLTLQSATGRSLAGVSCHLFTSAGSYLNAARTTNDAGQALFDLATGSYKFRIDYRGYQFWTDTVTLPGAGSLTYRIAEETVAVTTLRAGAAQSGASVYLFTQAGTYLNQSAKSDASGQVSFVLPAGKAYTFRADFLGSQYWSAPWTVVAGGPNQPTVDMGGGALTVVVDRGDGRPIIGARMYLFGPTGSYLGVSAETGAAGEAAFGVSSGSYEVRCDYLGYQFWSEPLQVSADATMPLTIPHRDVLVTVSGEYEGTTDPRVDLPVYLYTTAGGYLNVSARTDEQGRVTLSLPERDYKVRVDYRSYSSWSEPIQGTEATVVIPEAIAEVSVIRGLEPLPGAPVYLFSPAGQYLNISAVSDALGKVAFRLPAESFLFRADDLGDQFFSAAEPLEASRVNPVSIALGGGTFSLTVDDGVSALPGVSVYLFDENGHYLNRSRVTNAAGTAGFDLANGFYRVRADYIGHQFWSDMIHVPNVMSAQILIPRREVAVTLQGDYAGDVRPLSSAPVYLFTDAGKYLGLRSASGEDGRTTFDLPQRPYKVRADYLGAHYWSSTFTWEDRDVTIREGIAQVTFNRAGAPVSAALVHVFGEGGSCLGLTAITDAAGTARFRLPEGAYRFAADVQGSRYFGSGLVAAAAISPIDLSTGGGLFSLTLDASDGRLLADVPVHAFTSSGTYLGVRETTDSQGRALFTLSSGDYRFRADYLGRQFWTGTHAVPAESSAVLTAPSE